MIDLKLLREQPEEVLKIYRDRLFDEDAAQIARKLVDLDTRRRQIVATSDELKQKRNAGSAAVGREKDPDKRKQLIADMEGMKGQIAQADQAITALDEELQTMALQLPNLPDPSVPVGRSDAENKVVREVGDKRQLAFAAKPHWELGTELGIIDFERGVKISGSRFYLLRGAGARLQRALISWMIDVHVEQGYSEIYPPYMVKRDCLVGTGNLPKFGENLYRDAEEDYYWVPTAEVPVTNMYRDEVLDAEALPIKHVAYTACFRREKMAHGKDTRGIKRGHQFDKVEMYKFVAPEESTVELERLVANAEETCRGLGLT
jgi:seryl-tRNA synthetase